MGRRYDPETGDYGDEDDGGVDLGPPAPPAPTAPTGGATPSNGPGAPADYHGLDYWATRGTGPQNMFAKDASGQYTGQLLPQWKRTATGYELVNEPQYEPIGASFGGGSRGRMDFGMGGGGYAPDFNWPHFNAPSFSAPPAFGYEKFTPPSPTDTLSNPTYKMLRDEGLNTIEHGAAAKGLTRLPATLKALAGWNQDYANRFYGDEFNRGLQTYGTNRNNAADASSLNDGISRDVFDRNYTGAKDMFNFNEYEPAKLTFADIYNRDRDLLNARTQLQMAALNGNP